MPVSIPMVHPYPYLSKARMHSRWTLVPVDIVSKPIAKVHPFHSLRTLLSFLSGIRAHLLSLFKVFIAQNMILRAMNEEWLSKYAPFYTFVIRFIPYICMQVPFHRKHQHSRQLRSCSTIHTRFRQMPAPVCLRRFSCICWTLVFVSVRIGIRQKL